MRKRTTIDHSGCTLVLLGIYTKNSPTNYMGASTPIPADCSNTVTCVILLIIVSSSHIASVKSISDD